MNAQPLTFSLRDPKAIHTGQIHYVYFQIRGDRAVIVTDDCVWHQTLFMSVEQAREEWKRYARLGFVRWDHEPAARIVEAKVREINEQEDSRERYKAAMSA